MKTDFDRALRGPLALAREPLARDEEPPPTPGADDSDDSSDSLARDRLDTNILGARARRAEPTAGDVKEVGDACCCCRSRGDGSGEGSGDGSPSTPDDADITAVSEEVATHTPVACCL